MMKRLSTAALLTILILQSVPMALAWTIERPGDQITIDEFTGSGKTRASNTDPKIYKKELATRFFFMG
jgi:hypothetical protein